MRKNLTVAIEAISLITAIGVVVSVFIYSLQFAALGLSYSAFASLSDMLRDSIKLLVFFLTVFVTIAIPITLSISPSMSTRSRAFRLAYAVIFTALYMGIILVGVSAINSIGGIEPKPYSVRKFIVIGLMCAGLFAALFGIFSFRPPARLLGSDGLAAWFNRAPLAVRMVIASSALPLLFYPVYSASQMTMRQLNKGLSMNVDVGEVEACKDSRSYTVIWMGDSKAVVRCEPSKILVVKALL